jgi:hypothetical protein
MSRGYPANYNNTIEQAHKEVEIGVAKTSIDEIEERWVRVTSCEGYTMHDLRKEVLLEDIEELLRCAVVFINKIDELATLLQHRKPKKPGRIPKALKLPKEGI